MRTQFATALDALRWALAFHRRHLVVISALMAVPTLQRFIIMSWDLPGALATTSEVLVMVARVGLVGYAISKVGPVPHASASAKAFLRTRWPSLLITLGLLALAFTVFDLGLERLAPLTLPADAEDTYRSILFALKNLTVIPLTMIWMVSVVRQVLRYPADRAVTAHR